MGTGKAGNRLRTVKEISDLTGISVRTLHYYDEIGLLRPSGRSGAGYRLYDDRALEELRQILFFREFDIPLKEIKALMDHPALGRNQILKMQREMLVAKKERMERLIASIDGILEGGNQMDFAVFDRTEIEEMYNAMAANMNEEQKAVFVGHYGSMEKWRENFLKKAATKEAQRNFQKVAEWYGGKEAALEAAKNPCGSDVFPAYQKRMGEIIGKLSGMMGRDVDSFEIRQLVGEYDFVAKQLYQMEDVTALMLEIAAGYRTDRALQDAQDGVYGKGSTEYVGRAIEAFYRR